LITQSSIDINAVRSEGDFVNVQN